MLSQYAFYEILKMKQFLVVYIFQAVSYVNANACAYFAPKSGNWPTSKISPTTQN